MEQLLHACQEESHTSANFIWVEDTFLLENGVGMWSELPLWLPESQPETAGFFAFEVRKALEAGLAFRPLSETVRDTLAWARKRPADHKWRAGLTRQRERELLRLWKEQMSAC